MRKKYTSYSIKCSKRGDKPKSFETWLCDKAYKESLMGFKEIAELLGISEGYAITLYKSGMDKIKNHTSFIKYLED